MYQKVIKRLLDIVCSCLILLFFGWVYIILAVIVRIKLGSPVIFRQPRPGKKDKNGNETVFYLYKFRSMADKRDETGRFLPDEARMTPFGTKLRDTSLDELPEILNILKGEMSLVGPRPQLVRDMVFMSKEQRKRHDVTPGLTGLAQVSGRNAISWDEKLAIDLQYIEKITFWGDLKILLKTILKVLKKEDTTTEGTVTSYDYGDLLLKEGRVSREEYESKQKEAEDILKAAGKEE